MVTKFFSSLFSLVVFFLLVFRSNKTSLFVFVMAGYDVDYFRLFVRSEFARSQLQFSLASLKSPVNFSTEGLILVCNAPCLLFVAQEAGDALFNVLRERFHGMRRSTTNAFLLLNARTVSGHDLCTSLVDAGIAVRFLPFFFFVLSS